MRRPDRGALRHPAALHRPPGPRTPSHAQSPRAQTAGAVPARPRPRHAATWGRPAGVVLRLPLASAGATARAPTSTLQYGIGSEWSAARCPQPLRVREGAWASGAHAVLNAGWGSSEGGSGRLWLLHPRCDSLASQQAPGQASIWWWGSCSLAFRTWEPGPQPR